MFFSKKNYIFALTNINTMGLYTSDRLKAMFEASKQRHQQEREQRKQERQQQYQLLCKQADQLLKKAQEDAKNKLMVQLQALAPKKPQIALKQHSQQHYDIYHSNLIERDPSERDLYTTREQLKRWEATHWNCINWSKWNEVINDTKKKLGL